MQLPSVPAEQREQVGIIRTRRIGGAWESWFLCLRERITITSVLAFQQLKGGDPAKLGLRSLRRGCSWYFWDSTWRLVLGVWIEPGRWTKCPARAKWHYLGDPDRNNKQTSMSQSLIPAPAFQSPCIVSSWHNLTAADKGARYHRAGQRKVDLEQREQHSLWGPTWSSPCLTFQPNPSTLQIVYSIPVTFSFGFFSPSTQVHFHLQAFALAMPSTYNTFFHGCYTYLGFNLKPPTQWVSQTSPI